MSWIGDNLGLILPKELLDSCGFRDEATVTVHNKPWLFRPVRVERVKIGMQP